MAQDAGKILPKFINTDTAYQDLKPEEAPFILGLSWDVNGNPENGDGVNNPSGEGQNMFALSPIRSNEAVPNVLLPAGINKNGGSYESTTTRELYSFNINSLGNHGIYVLSGDTGSWQTVVIDPKLAFTDDQEGFIANCRVALRYVKDKEGNVIEKHLVWTNGKKWQGWVNVVAAIATNGFDAGAFPYWVLKPPHFDREELLEWPVRPCMIKPIVETIPNTSADIGKVNRLVDRALRFAVARQTTDGRTSILSPYSLPLLVKSEEFLNNPDNIPKNATITIDAGSPLTEKLLIFMQRAGAANTIDSLSVWNDWILYDTIEKFDTPAMGAYWLRTNPWSTYNYDPVFNTIEYTFDNSKTGSIISQADAMMLQPGMPQISQALFDLDDAVALAGNRYGYNNFSKQLLDKITAVVKEKESQTCSFDLVDITVYGYVGMCDSTFQYMSQVGYINGTDKIVRFGGLRPASSNKFAANIDIPESKFFGLDFSDKKAFRLYAKGTPYFVDATWVQVNSDNSIVDLPDTLDFTNADTLEFIQSIFQGGGYLACRWVLKIPKGIYNLSVGRHSVASAGDFRNTSTYVYGIANSRVKSLTSRTSASGSYNLVTIKPNAIGSFSKEMEIDCTAGSVDVWGNNADMFYIYCPYNEFSGGHGRFRFIEGYLQESQDSPLGIELFPYRMTRSNIDDGGQFTDKNGFYWAYTKAADSSATDIQFVAKINCAYPTQFDVPTSQGGTGWKQNKTTYLSDNNGGVVGDCNRILYTGKITDLTGLIGYSNVAISIKDGPTVYTRNDGTFTLVVHNGMSTSRSSNVYVNAGGNFFITVANCGQVPVTSFNEALVPCSDCNVRTYPIQLNLNVVIQNNSQTSVKEGGKYSIGLIGADFAGRVMNVNVIRNLEVSTFLERNNINATYFQLQILAALNIFSENTDIKWISPYVSKNVIIKRYVQWVGDELIYLDNSGNVVSDATTASFIKIKIDSLYQSNIRNNFSLLSSYQFAKEDRLRAYDNGDGRLFDVATYGDPIDVQVLGTDYNQAAINAGLLLPQTNTVLPGTTAATDTSVGLIVRYDSRLDKLSGKTGFWIEVYSPTQENDIIPFLEVPGFYPVIGGEISEFTGYNNGVPTYTQPAEINLDFWDTYYLQRSISGKYFSHPFESPNVTDNWGANITSGGRINVEDKDAKQIWLGGDVIRSDSFLRKGRINGLAMFRDENRKNYGVYPFGAITAAHSKRNVVLFNCENNWFVVDYNMPYAKVSNGNLVVTNLDENLSMPHPKVGGVFGLSKEDIGSLVIDEDFVFWFDRKNTGFIKSNYDTAIDITQVIADERGGLQSYINAKTYFVSRWNEGKRNKDKFDVVAGLDGERANVYLTFRPRRNNSNDPYSYVNTRRNFDVRNQETFVYSIQFKGWLPCANYAPESYARLRGSHANVEFITFAGGKPYINNNTDNSSFLNFFGVQTEPCFIGVFNKEPDTVKVLQAISQQINGSSLFADQIYDTQKNGFTYLPVNYWKNKEKNFYSEVLRNMVSYPSINPDELFRSMLVDGKRTYGNFIVCRFVQKFFDLGKYFQLSALSYLDAESMTVKP